jgi:sulfite exporter TauE/SafE
MAPSRGTHAIPNPDQDTAVDQQSNSALISAKRNFNYLISPTNADRPARFRTRALLRSVRYVSTFIFWRLVRWAKYIAIGSLVAAVGATAIGSAVSGVAWVVAPTSIGASVLAAGVWGVGRFAARRFHARWMKHGGDLGEEIRERAEERTGDVRREGSYGVDVGPRAVPW